MKDLVADFLYIPRHNPKFEDIEWTMSRHKHELPDFFTLRLRFVNDCINKELKNKK